MLESTDTHVESLDEPVFLLRGFGYLTIIPRAPMGY